KMTEDEIFTYLERRRGILDGVCITGGEPLLQSDLLSFLLKVKEMGYLVKLDTNGMLPKRLAAVLAANAADYVAMDVKSSPDGYAKATGGVEDVAPFEESMKLLRASGVSYEFRTTAVKGIHTLEDFSAIARWLRPEDPYFIQQFVDSGELLGEGCTAFSPEEMQQILSAVQKHLPHAGLRGI
ncbi:MAG: anaerobic ribonucleoside-triphosphate reductase activating protein, partial [Ruminococcaceae bacterium]|nr:anaerobic ribonucleoside-triphosphate reductase activating protein [Oscillospiraceae bacterium]